MDGGCGIDGTLKVAPAIAGGVSNHLEHGSSRRSTGGTNAELSGLKGGRQLIGWIVALSRPALIHMAEN
jgi:hypothetical protein